MFTRILARQGWVVLLPLLLLAACQSQPVLPPESSAPRPPAAPYVIGPGDSINIFVFREPELTISVPVRPDGRVSIPLVEDIEAAGRTPTQLARDIEQRLRDYVRDPTVTVIMNGFVGPSDQLVRVIGEATDPVAIPYRDGMTLLDVMIATRGLTRFAAGNRAQILRRQPIEGQPRLIPVRLSDLIRDGDISQDMPMRPGDTLIIPQSWF